MTTTTAPNAGSARNAARCSPLRVPRFFASALIFGTRDGGPFEIPFLRVIEFDALGRIIRIDLYDVDEVDVARARFAEVGASR